MKLKMTNRQFLSAIVFLFYCMPLFFFTFYSLGLMSRAKSWSLLSAGLLLVVSGTLILILLLYYWERSLQSRWGKPLLTSSTDPLVLKEAKVTSLDAMLLTQTAIENELTGVKESNHRELNLLQENLEQSQFQVVKLNNVLEQRLQEIKQGEELNKHLQLKVQQVAQDFTDYKVFSDEQLKQKQLQMNNLQQVIEDQRIDIEKRQEQMQQLEMKVHDLSYEIKTLLYLQDEVTTSLPPLAQPQSNEEFFTNSKLNGSNESIENKTDGPLPFIQRNNEAAQLLHKCLAMAEKLTGASYHGNESSRYREFSSSHYAIDQRRLFDNLRSETHGLILVYSQKEQKILFVNQQAKTFLGWSPEKVISDFSSIIPGGLEAWKKAMASLANSSEAPLTLLAKTRQGQEILLNGYLGIIAGGLFRNYIIGVFYPT